MSADTEPGIASRAAALDVLSTILRKRQPLDAALERLAGAHLAQRDAGFARAIVGETLRRFGQLDALVRTFVPRTPPAHRAGSTLEILLAGACELLFLNVAAHAAVDGANRVAARDDKAIHFKPLINATLRRIAREGAAVLARQDAERLNTPDWLWARWSEAYGEDTARIIARAHLEPAPLDILLKSPQAKEPFGVGAIALPGDMVRLRNTAAVDALPGFGDGTWWVQDFAASLPARLFGDVRGKTVFDLCAAPGGKTAQLASAGARVTAVDREPERLARLRANLGRLGLSADIVQADIRDFKAREPADCVLLDAPCSATGTIRRHPDLPWIKSAADINACSQTASELLDAASAQVTPGGILVFAVCSLEREECDLQVADFLRRNASFRRVPLAAADVLGLHGLVNAEDDLRTFPFHFADKGGMDGFYAVRLRRSG